MPHRHPKEKYQNYWRKNLQYLAILLTIWFSVSYLFGILLVDQLDRVRIGGFGLAAASFFPAIVMGIFSRRMNREGAITGMIIGITFTAAYIIYFKFMHPELNNSDHWWLGVSPEGIGTLGMLFNFASAILVSRFTPKPPRGVVEMVDRIRIPSGAGKAHELSV